MKDVDGFAFASWVRGKPQLKEVPLIALSSFTSKEMVDRGLKAGFDKFVNKAQGNQLLDALHAAV
jgi:CheY-like chemotaxis protein